jgi:CDP-4-dehydro-6-deoxyglucose reductase
MYSIALSPVGDTVFSDPDETVLGAILRSGASVAFTCRGGSCGTCKMRAIAGRVEHGRCSAAALPEEERRAGWFLSCQARPLTDLTIELTVANRYRVLTWWHRPTRRDA